MRTASATSSYGITDSTGPKISSWAIRIRLSTPAKTVGRTYQPLVEPVGHPETAGQQLGALLLAEGDVLLDALLLALRDHRADLGRGVHRVADLHPRDRLGQRRGERVVPVAADQHPGLRDAGLAGVHDADELEALQRGGRGRRRRARSRRTCRRAPASSA